MIFHWRGNSDEFETENKALVHPQSRGNLALDDKGSWEFQSQKAINLSLVLATKEAN